jgi:predicted Fe-Mo cluster-binding NifX family protein
MRIEEVININGYTLMVYYTPGRCYQFSIIDVDGMVYDFDDIFYTAEAAEREGRAAIRVVSD